nr:MAG TPA: hypothetical protein [Caudoviricetes sp.]
MGFTFLLKTHIRCELRSQNKGSDMCTLVSPRGVEPLIQP